MGRPNVGVILGGCRLDGVVQGLALVLILIELLIFGASSAQRSGEVKVVWHHAGDAGRTIEEGG